VSVFSVALIVMCLLVANTYLALRHFPAPAGPSLPRQGGGVSTQTQWAGTVAATLCCLNTLNKHNACCFVYLCANHMHTCVSGVTTCVTVLRCCSCHVCCELLSSHQHVKFLDWGRRLQLLSEVASALAYMHAQGVVHGDLCSSGIFIGGDGRVRPASLQDSTGAARQHRPANIHTCIQRWQQHYQSGPVMSWW